MDINLTVATYSKRICSAFRDWFVVLELKDNQIVTYLSYLSFKHTGDCTQSTTTS